MSVHFPPDIGERSQGGPEPASLAFRTDKDLQLNISNGLFQISGPLNTQILKMADYLGLSHPEGKLETAFPQVTHEVWSQ